MKKKITYPLKSPIFNLIILIITLSLQAQELVSYEPAFPNLTFQVPVEIQNSGDGTDRLFVVEQNGRIKVFNNDKFTSQLNTFLDITNLVSFSSGQEIGLLGLAFHPNYSQNGYFYVYHTRSSNVSGVGVEVVLARYTVSASNPNQANPSSRLDIFSFDKNQSQSNHNGGKIAFGPDGYLYISIGDGGGGGDPKKNAQNLNNPFGSILRIDVDLDGNNPLENNPDTPNGRYEIPSDNPRVNKSGLDELYAWGIRNTWKFSFDPPTNRIWSGDVGQGEFEEINLIENGGNYGWNRFEGNSTFSNNSLVTTPDIKPVFEYNHNNGDVSITGGYVYRGAINNTRIKNKYIYGDYVSGRVWSLDYNGTTGSASSTLLFRANGLNVSSFGLDEAGEIYFSSYGNSAQIYNITDGSTQGPPLTAVNGIGSWAEVSGGTNGGVNAVVTSGNSVYVGGSFTTAGNVNAKNIAKFTDGQWSALGSGANGEINAIAVASNGTVYAGGDFTSIGGVSANNIARWNGTSWSALNSGVNGTVLTLKINNSGVLYVGGIFDTANGTQANNIASYNGSWSVLADATTGVVGTNNEIRSIAFDENNLLYIGGNFDSAGGKSANRIATYNGSTWGTLGTGTSGFVQAISITDDFVFAGGNFAIAGGQTVNRIARWNRNTNSWSTLGNGVSGNVNDMVINGDYLYVAGNFETAAPNSSTNYRVKNIARWSASQGWQALGNATDVGTNNQINAIALSNANGGLYAGGNFQQAGINNVNNLAVWNSGSISREYWTGISGNKLTDLTGNSAYPSSPSGIDQLSSFEAVDWNNPGARKDWADAYGQRIRGYITAPESGQYTFWVAADDETELYLSTNDDPNNKTRIAFINGWSEFREWDKFSSQKSANITLTAGQRYYVEVLHKEGNGGDAMSIGWRKPGQSSTAPSQVIPGNVLSPFFDLSGSILREYWTGIAGDQISNLINNSAYPNSPTGRDQLRSLEAVDWDNPSVNQNWADSYGERIRGYITAPVSGQYNFWIAGNNDSELYLSTDDSESNKTRIAYLETWTGFRQWNKFSTQKSATITLTAGTRYYVEVLHKEGVNGDAVSVGWRKPGQATGAPAEIVPGYVLTPFTSVTTGSNTVLREYWTGISGNPITNLTGNSNYPNNPTGSDQLTSLEAVDWNNPSITKDWANAYGQRIRGYITAPVTGQYNFWIAGDDHSDLYLSTDDTEANKQRIANIVGWTEYRQWNKFSSQKSATITLTGGQRYYVEVLHKEGNGGDALSVGWRKPGQSTGAPSEVVPGSVLSPFIVSQTPPMASIAGTYYLKNVATGLYMDSEPNGVVIQSNPRTGADVRWNLIESTPGYYFIDADSSGRGPLAANPSPSTMTYLDNSFLATPFENREFEVQPLENNIYRFLCKDASRGYVTAIGTNSLGNRTDGNDEAAHWELIPVGNAKNALASNEKVANTIITLYPNPTNGNFTISSVSKYIKQVSIVSMSGRVIYNEDIKTPQTKIEINESLPTGIYLIKITDNEGTNTIKKMVVE